jgi:hypothetical protein
MVSHQRVLDCTDARLKHFLHGLPSTTFYSHRPESMMAKTIAVSNDNQRSVEVSEGQGHAPARLAISITGRRKIESTVHFSMSPAQDTFLLHTANAAR